MKTLLLGWIDPIILLFTEDIILLLLGEYNLPYECEYTMFLLWEAMELLKILCIFSLLLKYILVGLLYAELLY